MEADIHPFETPPPDATAPHEAPESLADTAADHRRRVETLEALTRLSRKTAHALNNFLMVFAGGIDLVKTRLQRDPDGARRMLTTMADAVGGAQAFLDRLRLVRGPDTQDPIRLDLPTFVERLRPDLEEAAGEDLVLVLEAEDSPCQVDLDPETFATVLRVLLDNAREAEPTDRRIVVRTKNARVNETEALTDLPPGSYAVLEVEDTGVGMDPETRSRLFEPFFTTKSTVARSPSSSDEKSETKRPERGLGLATVWGIVRQAHGSIQVESTPGRGTIVRIHIPCHEVPVDASPEKAEAAPVDRTTILVVDDEPPVLQFVTDALKGMDCELLLAANGNEALEQARAHPGRIHVLLIDVVMPDANGPEVAKSIMAIHPETHVIFMSGYGEDVLYPMHGGLPTPFLAKPFTPDALEQKIRAVVGPDPTS